MEYVNGVHYTLDATSIKRYTGLGGNSFVDVWVSYRLDEKAHRNADCMADGQPSGLDFGKLQEIKTRYLFQLAGDFLGRHPLKLIVAKQYLDGKGNLLFDEAITQTGSQTKWYTLDAVEQKVLLKLVTQTSFHSGQKLDPLWSKFPAAIEADEGFLGVPWGATPDRFRGDI